MPHLLAELVEGSKREYDLVNLGSPVINGKEPDHEGHNPARYTERFEWCERDKVHKRGKEPGFFAYFPL